MPKLLFLVRNMNCAYNTNIQLTLEPLKLCLNLVLTVKMEGEKNEKLFIHHILDSNDCDELAKYRSKLNS